MGNEFNMTTVNIQHNGWKRRAITSQSLKENSSNEIDDATLVAGC